MAYKASIEATSAASANGHLDYSVQNMLFMLSVTIGITIDYDVDITDDENVDNYDDDGYYYGKGCNGKLANAKVDYFYYYYCSIYLLL